MRLDFAAMMAFVVIISSAARSWGAEDNPSPQNRAIAEIQKWGGKFEVDSKRPDGPVIKVFLRSTKINNAGLALLDALPQIQGLDLEGSRITDAGLAHVKGLADLQRLSLINTDVTDAGLVHLAGLRELRSLDLNLIASGGVRTGLQAAKALAMGAKLVGFALPVLRAYVSGGIVGVEAFLKAFGDELRVALMLCGCARIDDLTPDHAVIGGRLLEWVEQRGLAAR